MSIKIIKPGILDTLQDLGRYGYQQFGINPSGAMDRYAMKIGNALLGNDPGEAVIEIHFPASVFLFTGPALIALSGADFSPAINGEPVSINQPIIVTKNDLLHFQKPLKGARVYLSVAGGFQIEKWLNSCSTNLKAMAGGFKGRNLMKDDEITFRKNDSIKNVEQFKPLPWLADPRWEEESDPNELFVMPGNEWEQLTGEAKDIFINQEFLISPQSDRMGYRLDNAPMKRKTNEELLSTAVSFGTIQLLPDGKLIVLAADHQTTGGYPRVGHVITAHHSKLAQLKAGDKIRFKLTDLMSAENLLMKQEYHLQQLRNACSFRLNTI